MEPVTTARAEFDESGKPTKHVYVIDDDPQVRHRANALGKLKCKSIAEVMRIARDAGIVV